jgi:hypothetical protein
MYEHSRTLFTELKPLLRDPDAPVGKRQLLRCCEGAVQQLRQGTEPERASRLAFREVRPLLALNRALEALEVMQRQLAELQAALDQARTAPLAKCAATNRKGAPCGRDALRGRPYCASHRGLAGTPAPPVPDAVILLRRPPDPGATGGRS